MWLALAVPVAGQDPPDTLPPPPDSLALDSLALDSLALDSLALDSLALDSLGLDSLGLDTLAVDSLAPDSLAADSLDADSLPPPPVLPTLPDPVPAGFATGVWEWDREALLSTHGQTLWELLARVPGVLAIRSGDFGSAVAAVPVGHGGGSVRVYHDGVEQLPLDGAVPDLAQVALSALERVRVVRRPGGLDVHLYRRVHSDVRPMSRIEAGTGDLDTNLLRATFSFPRAFGGKAAFAIERLDTKGRSMPGAVTGAVFRYSLHRGDAAGVRFEIRRAAADRDPYTPSPGTVSRSDRTISGAWRPAPGLLAEAWSTSGSITTSDSLQGFAFLASSRSQHGARLSAQRGPVWGRVTARMNSGTGIPEREMSAELSLASGRWGGVSARARRESWEPETGASSDVAAWFTPIEHVTLFAERSGGRRSVPYLAPLPPEDTAAAGPGARGPGSAAGPPFAFQPDDTTAAGPSIRFTDRSGSRLGATARWRGIELSGARIAVEADSVRPTDLLFDRDGLVVSQPSRKGWELAGRIPLLPQGLAFVAEVQLWEPADSSLAYYFPDHLYRGSLSFHRVFRETGNFELWVDLGARGRSPMRVPLGVAPEPDEDEAAGAVMRARAAQARRAAGGHGFARAALSPDDDEIVLVPDVVPFYQDWYFRLQMRILSLNIFATVENLTLRRNNQDMPGRLLPGTRSFYGVRWTFWN